MPASVRSGSELKEGPSKEEGDVIIREGQSSFKESAWDTFRANLTRRRHQLHSRSTSSASQTRSSDSRREPFSDIHPHDRPYYGPRPEDQEESKFGEALAGLMQRRGYCDEVEETQQEYGSVRRLISICLDTIIDRTWRCITNQTPRKPLAGLGSGS